MPEMRSRHAAERLSVRIGAAELLCMCSRTATGIVCGTLQLSCSACAAGSPLTGMSALSRGLLIGAVSTEAQLIRLACCSRTLVQ